MLRKAGSAVSASRSTSDVVDDGEKGSKLRREKEGRTRSIVVLCGMLCFVALAAIAKYNRFTDMRAPPSVRRRRSIVRGVNAAADRRNLEPMDANHINNGDGINENGSGISSNNNNDQEHNGLTIPKFLPPHSIYSQTVDDAQGNPMALNDLHGLITLVVNVACKTSVTYQQLAQLQHKYNDRGFAVLAFPTNDFRQELGSNAEIAQFLSDHFPQVDFPIFGLSSLEDNTVYQALRKQMPGAKVRHNFFKYLVDENGIAVHFYPQQVDPISIEADIEELLEKRESVGHKFVTE